MNLSRCLCPLKTRVRSREILRKLSTTARLSEAAPSAQPLVQQEKFDFEDLKVLERVERRKQQIPPFMKNAFMSIFNCDMLTYPEILNKEEYETLESRVQTLENILNNTEMSETDKQNAIKRTKIFGAPIKLTQGGFALIATERVRYLEALSVNLKLAQQISDHWVAVGALKLGLPEEELDKITQDLIDGETSIALCTNEKISTRITQADFRTKATLQVDDTWQVTGEKLCRQPDGYKLALCAVEESRIRALLVHPDARGVSHEGNYVKFDETPATALSNMTEVEMATTLALTRLDTAVLACGALRRLILRVSEHVRGKFVSGHPLGDLPLLRIKVSEALLTVYTAESMVYFTAGLLDGYEKPDVDLEVAMCRSYVTERLVDCALRLLSAVGLDALEGEWAGTLDELRALQLKDEQMDPLNIFIALTGMQHVGKLLAENVKQMRNPLFHPGYIFKKIFADRHQAADNPKMTLHLEEYLHPSLRAPAQHLEYCVLRLRYASELALGRHGSELYLQHPDLERLAKAATETYAMTATLARASRAYCIGLRNGDAEIRIASTLAELGRKRVQALVLEIDDGEYMNLDRIRLDVGRRLLDTGHLPQESPLRRVWW